MILVLQPCIELIQNKKQLNAWKLYTVFISKYAVHSLNTILGFEKIF